MQGGQRIPNDLFTQFGVEHLDFLHVRFEALICRGELILCPFQHADILQDVDGPEKLTAFFQRHSAHVVPALSAAGKFRVQHLGFLEGHSVKHVLVFQGET